VNWTLWPESPKSPNHDVETILKARFTGKIEIDVVFSVLDRTFSTWKLGHFSQSLGMMLLTCLKFSLRRRTKCCVAPFVECMSQQMHCFLDWKWSQFSRYFTHAKILRVTCYNPLSVYVLGWNSCQISLIQVGMKVILASWWFLQTIICGIEARGVCGSKLVWQCVEFTEWAAAAAAAQKRWSNTASTNKQ
jgi:hypothetical protein